MPLKGLRLGRNHKDDTAPPSSSKREQQEGDCKPSTEISGHSKTIRATSVEPKSRKPLPPDPSNSPSDVDRDHLAPPRTSNGDSRPSSRLSRFKLRHHSSDTQLATTAKSYNEIVPPVPAVPPTPAIITTSPTLEVEPKNPPQLVRKRSKLLQFGRKQSENPSTSETSPQDSDNEPKKSTDKKRTVFSGVMASKDPAAELRKLAGARLEAQLNASDGQQDGDLSQSSTQESSPSQTQLSFHSGNSGANSIQSLFDDGKNKSFTFLPSRKQRNRKSLFPLLDNPPTKPHTAPTTAAPSPRPSTSTIYPDLPGNQGTWPRTSHQASMRSSAEHPKSSTSTTFSNQHDLERTSSVISDRSTRSSPALRLPITRRGRSSTAGSGSGRSEETPPTPFAGESGRNSTSTAGRSSFSNLFHIGHRFHRHDPQSPRQESATNIATQSSFASGSNSMTLSRDTIALPEREEGETAIQYLKRVEALVPRSEIPSILSQRLDEFHYTVMRSFMRTYVFFGDPLDMAIRKLLIEIVLPKETQQIDRVLQSFADRYQECNPGIFSSADKVHVTTFSVLMLHTDAFNKNNKRKMSKVDYLKNLSGQGVADDVLECFYDNIVYTPFIHLEDDQDILTMRTRKTDRKTAKAAKAAKAAIKNVPGDSGGKRTTREPLDPYTLIFESRLDTLRPTLKHVIQLDDTYSYLGSLPLFDKRIVHHTKVGVIQIESNRSRPNAFMSQSGIENPEHARVGLVDIPIDKVGVLWRKDTKKRAARSPWSEWGAILTGAGLYFFKNATWVKDYLHQYETWVKHNPGIPCMFNPPITNFKPDSMMPTDHGVALQDANYKRHKNAFTFFRHNNSEEVFLADNELEMNDWLARLNHQSACKTAGIRQRGIVGGHYEGQRHRGMRRLEGSGSGTNVERIQTPTGEVTIQKGRIDHELAQQISAARLESIKCNIEEAEEKMQTTSDELEEELGNARHLMILAPIQQKTRDQIIVAAEKVQARIKWMRVEWWRLRCHSDILEIELEEEEKELEKIQDRIEKMKMQSNGSVTLKDGEEVNRIVINRPSSKDKERPSSREKQVEKPRRGSAGMSSNSTIDDDDAYLTPAETPAQSPVSKGRSKSPTSNTASKKIPRALHGHNFSISSNYSHSSHLQPQAPRPSLDQSLPSPTASASEDVATSDDERATARSEPLQTGLNGDTSRPVTPMSANSKEQLDVVPEAIAVTPEQQKKRRHSIQLSLREGRDNRRLSKRHSRSKQGSKELKDEDDQPLSNSTTTTSGGGSSTASPVTKSKPFPASDTALNATGLRRDKPSFTIHGKKASVVTIEGEWAKDAEETLQRIKAASTTIGSDKGEPVTSPLGRSVSTAITDGDAESDVQDDVTIKGLDTETSTTPTPSSPGGSVCQPRNSSLRFSGARRASARSHQSSAGMSARSNDQHIEGESSKNRKTSRDGSVDI